MAGFHVDVEQCRGVAGRVVAEFGDEFGGFPVGHARVRQAAGCENRRVVEGRDIVVRRVGGDGVVSGVVCERVAPFGPFRRCEGQRGVRHGVQHVNEWDRRDDAGPEIGPHVEHGAHQKPAGGAAMRDDTFWRRQVLRDQVLGDRDEIGKRVLLFRAPAIEEPVPALFRAAADMGDDMDPAAIDKR